MLPAITTQIHGHSVTATPPSTTPTVPINNHAEPMMSHQLVINTKPAVQHNAKVKLADIIPSDYSDLLVQEKPFTCQFSDSNAPAAPCVFKDGLFAFKDSDGENKPLNGKVTLSCGDIIISTSFLGGLPFELARISIVMSTSETHTYGGRLIPPNHDKQWTVLCDARLVNEEIVITDLDGVCKKLGDHHYAPLNTVANVMLNGGILIGGQWINGQPDGVMVRMASMALGGLAYSGPMHLLYGTNARLVRHGKGCESYTTFQPEEITTAVIVGEWDKDELIVSTAQQKMRVESQSSTTTTISIGETVIKEIIFSTTPKKGTINWPTESKLYDGDIDIENEWPHGRGKITFGDKSIYEGGFVQGKRQGKGTATYADKTVYTGDYHDDTRHGDGDVAWGAGNKLRANHRYIGKFEKDKRSGLGTYIYPSGKSIKGEWDNNKLIQFSGDHGTYTGKFNDEFEQLNGEGQFVAKNGSIYKGKWENSRFEGEVIIADRKFLCRGPINDQGYLDGAVVIQTHVDGKWSRKKTKENWKNGVPQNQATPPQPAPPSKPVKSQPVKTVLSVTQDISKPQQPPELKKIPVITNYLGIGKYEGKLSSGGSPGGAGTITGIDGTVYQGEFNNGKLVDGSTVIIINPNKYQYKGTGEIVPLPEVTNSDQFVFQPAGAGEVHNPSGELVCSGTWKDGKPVTLIYPDHSEFVGSVDDQYQPVQGVMTLADKTIIKGQWQAGQLVEGSRISPDGSVYTGAFDDQRRPHGKGNLTRDDGRSFEGLFDHGQYQPIGATIKVDSLTYRPLSNYHSDVDALSFYGELHQGEGQYYVGPIQNGLPHGHGKFVIPNQLVYTGNFVDGRYHDTNGALWFHDTNATFVGSFIQGNVEGPGYYYQYDGTSYYSPSFTDEGLASLSFEGEILSIQQGYHFQGVIEQGLPAGQGTMTLLSSGVVISGQLYQ